MKLLIYILEIVLLISVCERIYHTEFVSSTQWFSEITNSIRVVLIFLAIIILLIIIKNIFYNKIHYLYVFFGLISLPLIYEYYIFTKEKIKLDRQIEYSNWERETADFCFEIWKELDRPEKAIQLFENLKPYKKNENEYDFSLIEINKNAFYLALGINNINFYNKFLESTKPEFFCKTIEQMLFYNYRLKKSVLNTDEDYLKIIKLIVKEKYPFRCISTNANRHFNFESLVNKNFYESALLMLSVTEINNMDYYMKIAKTISNEDIKKRIIFVLEKNSPKK